MCDNNCGWGGNGALWIILLLIVLVCCGVWNTGSGCGCNRNHTCGCAACVSAGDNSCD